LTNKIDLMFKAKIMAKIMTKFNICIIGMVVGIGLISVLPFMGLTCRWCTGAG
jgi:hypothetical protein